MIRGHEGTNGDTHFMPAHVNVPRGACTTGTLGRGFNVVPNSSSLVLALDPRGGEERRIDEDWPAHE